MLILLSAVFATLCSMFRSRAALELEHIALRHQIGVLKRSAGKRPKLTAADRLFWVFLSGLGGLALSAGHRQTRDRDRLASQGISPFLDLEDPAWPGGSARCFPRGPRSDPQDEPREPDLGRSPYPRGIAQTGHRD